MTLITGQSAIATENELYAYSPLIDFSAGSTGEDRVALSFDSPNGHYLCEVNASLDTSSWVADDIIAIFYRANGQIIFKAKWAVNATTIGQPQQITPLEIILPPNTNFKAIMAFQSATAMVGSGSVVLVGRKIA